MIFDVLRNTKENIARHKIATDNDARYLKALTVDFSEEMKAEIKLLRSFCAIILYAHQRGADGYEIAKNYRRTV